MNLHAPGDLQLCAQKVLWPCRSRRRCRVAFWWGQGSPAWHGSVLRGVCLICIKVGFASVAHGGSHDVEVGAMAKPFPLNPKHPERICWGCDRYCATDALACGNGSGRTQHPVEYQGEDWYVAWGIEPEPGRPGRAALQKL